MAYESLMKLEDFDFELPESLIALHPVEPRDSSRLMVFKRGESHFSHHVFKDLPDLLPPHAHLVVNNSKVIRARLLGTRKETGGKIEFLLLKQTGALEWEGIMKSGARQKKGLDFQITVPAGETELTGVLLSDAADSPSGIVKALFNRDPLKSEAGSIPLPPYIQRNPTLEDENRYQTVYSKDLGSAAAPTAGLHFTTELLKKIRNPVHEVTLHVGLGTFRPIQNLETHVMHEESYTISKATAEALTIARRSQQPIIAVGTTSLRTLESAWDDENQIFRAGPGDTRLFLHPGKKIRSVDGMITNFHLPRSSLILLVSAFAGTDGVRSGYREAIQKKYRFYSYGDAMLILPER